MYITVLARFLVKKECVQEVKKALEALVPLTKAEPGCINYDLYQENDNPQAFFLYENWQSEAHLDTHLQSKHLQDFLKRAPQLLEAPLEIIRATSVGV
jgi:quinol monooxygenase YgiN